MIDTRASRASRPSQPPRLARQADAAVGARGAAFVLLLSLMAGGGGVGVAEAITRLAHAAGVEATLRDGSGGRAHLARPVALLARSRSAAAVTAAAAPGASQPAKGAIADKARLLRAAAGPLTHSDLPPPVRSA